MPSQYQTFVDFVRKLYNQPEGPIYLHEPRFRGNEKKYLNECIDSTYVSSVGKFVDLFEQKIAEYTGTKYAVSAVNGTSALHIALLLSGINSGDEVITQPLTFIATANAITYTGARPVFIDVDKDTLGLSAEKLEHFLNSSTIQRLNSSTIPRLNSSTNKQECINKLTNKRIAACIPMHTFGHPCRIDEIREICEKYSIVLIEDAAESLGSFYKDQHTGTFGEIGVLSFNGNKTITTGGGGMIITNDRELALKAKHLTTQAKVPHKWDFVHDEIGYNYRLTNIQAALGVAQMEQLTNILKIKREIAEKYNDFFKDSDIEFVSEPGNARSNYWLNAIILKNRNDRDKFLEATNAKGILTRPAWELMNRLEMFKNCQVENIENAEWLADRLVNLPSSII